MASERNVNEVVLAHSPRACCLTCQPLAGRVRTAQWVVVSAEGEEEEEKEQQQQQQQQQHGIHQYPRTFLHNCSW